MSRVIHHTFAPLADSRQVRLALALTFQPRRWKEGPEQHMLKEELGAACNGEAHLFASGREALLALLTSLRLQKGEEVIVQGYTCVVVPNAILAAGMVPVYADIDADTLNLNLEEVERQITPKTRVVICQHTFGIPAYAQKLKELCNRHSLLLIEDCAHVLPDSSGPQDIGQYGDMLFFSFGRDKAISGVAGGAAVCKRPDLCTGLAQLSAEAKSLGTLRIKALLQYPLLYAIARPLYGTGIGKAMLALFGTLRMLVPIVTAQEKKGTMDATLHRMPNACAILALDQFRRRKEINDHRRALTQLYLTELAAHGIPLLAGIQPGLPLQKFPLFTAQAEHIRRRLKQQNIHLHDGWTGCVICPAAADSAAVGYRDGDDRQADMVGAQILSLPTHPGTTKQDAHRLVHALVELLALSSTAS